MKKTLQNFMLREFLLKPQLHVLPYYFFFSHQVACVVRHLGRLLRQLVATRAPEAELQRVVGVVGGIAVLLAAVVARLAELVHRHVRESEAVPGVAEAPFVAGRESVEYYGQNPRAVGGTG